MPRSYGALYLGLLDHAAHSPTQIVAERVLVRPIAGSASAQERARNETRSPLMMPNDDRDNEPTTETLEGRLAVSLARIGRLVGVCHQRLGSPLQPWDLDEVAQDTSLAAWRKRDSFEGDSDLDTWIYAIARNRILEHLRRKSCGPRVESSLKTEANPLRDPGPGPGTQADTAIARVISSALEGEGTTVATICRARALEGKSFVEISQDLRRGEANVKARFYRSLPRLRMRLHTLWNDRMC